MNVASCPIVPAASFDEFPTWVGYPQVLANITAGMPGGTPYTPTGGSPSSPYSPGGTGTPYYPYTPNNNGSPYNPSNPADEPGYCEVETTVEYVDINGNFLYAEKN
jgi:tyrosinase